VGQRLPGCCPNQDPFEQFIETFFAHKPWRREDKRYQLLEPEGRVLISPGASLKFIKKRFRTSEKGFGQQPVTQ
jgi:hypothetical protein